MNKNMKLTLAILLSIALYRGPASQTAITGKATTVGACSPAVTGNGNTFIITCRIGPDQGRKMVGILNSVLANQIDPDFVMLKLDEIIKATNIAAQPPCSGNTLTNCVAGDNFGSQTINGYVPPPNRSITSRNLEEASALLRKFPGANVRFVYIGNPEDQEINNFYNQIYGLFVNSGWHVAGTSRVGEQLTSDNGVISHGEGLGCSVTNSSQAGKIALYSLAIAGVPCAHAAEGVMNYQQPVPMPGQPSLPMPPLTDIYISVGTRILPQK